MHRGTESIFGIPKIFILDFEIDEQIWLEQSGQRLDNADQTHLVLVL